MVYTDTMMSNIKLIKVNTCAPIFVNDNHFVKVYPMESKAMAGDALPQVGRDYL